MNNNQKAVKQRNKLDNLLRGEKEIPSQNSKLSFSRRKLNQLCRSLSVESKKYDPACTMKLICDYLSNKNKIDRILYSEISNYIFYLDMQGRGTFATNIENLLQYTLSESQGNGNAVNVSDDCKKVVIKIYDHFQLALHQIENVNNILRNGTQEVVDNIRKENKGMEREYITILAIFSSIVVAFIGGVNFSNEVMKSINKASIYRLVLTIDGLGFVILNLVYMMIRLIFEINNMKIKNFRIWPINLIIALVALGVILLIVANAHMYPQYISQFQYWCNF